MKKILEIKRIPYDASDVRDMQNTVEPQIGGCGSGCGGSCAGGCGACGGGGCGGSGH